MDLKSQDPSFNAHLGLDQNLIWTKVLRCATPYINNTLGILQRKAKGGALEDCLKNFKKLRGTDGGCRKEQIIKVFSCRTTEWISKKRGFGSKNSYSAQ